MTYSIITPYLVPSEITHKHVNMGDGMILEAILKLLEPHESQYVFTSRKNLSGEDIEKINSTKALILAGSNQLNDHTMLIPVKDLETLERIKVPIFPFGVGIHGHPPLASTMTHQTREIILRIHERIRYSSWRCLHTMDYLIRHVPELKEKILMTGCPSMYGPAVLNGHPFARRENVVVVTVTERGDFWQREKKTIDFVASRYSKAEKVLSLHQFFKPSGSESAAKIWKKSEGPDDLRRFAEKKGFHIFVPRSARECMEYYARCDVHVGSRLHAHLYFLSQAKRSFVTHVDDRSFGLARTFGFPLCDYNRLSAYEDYDFEIYRQNCIRSYERMAKFINYLKGEVL